MDNRVIQVQPFLVVLPEQFTVQRLVNYVLRSQHLLPKVELLRLSQILHPNQSQPVAPLPPSQGNF
jgi:hypothetical protein